MVALCVLLIAGLLGAGCKESGPAGAAGGASGGGPPGGAAAGGPPPALVELAQVEDGTLTRSWMVQGEVRAAARAELAAGASGPVTEVAVREGDAVSRGDLLLRVDDALVAAEVAQAKAALAEAEVTLAQARRDLERLSPLGEGVVTAQSVEEAQSRVAALEARQEALSAAVRLAEARWGRHVVRAPFAGVVASRSVDPGDWVDPGRAVLELLSTEGAEVLVDGPEALLGQVTAGQKATLYLGGLTLDGVVRGIVPALDPVSRTVRLRVAPAGGEALVAGSTARVELAVLAPGGGVLVPTDALVSGPTGQRVVTVVDGKAAPVEVELLTSQGDRALVRGEGLAVGATVVVRGNERLRPGQPVTTGGP